ncbi:hypothetical protein OG403_21025 [Kitasatospora sp. NBC_01266]
MRIASSTVRVRWASFVGTFVALALGVGLLATATLTIVATGHLAGRPSRYDHAPVVVLPDTEVVVHDQVAGDQRVKVTEQPGLTPEVLAAVGRTGPVVADRTFYAQLLGGPKDQVGHGWSAAAFGGYRLLAGAPPQHPDEVVLGGGEAAMVGQRVRVLTADGPLELTVSGVRAAVPFEHALFFTDQRAAQLSPPVDALVAYGAPDQVRQAVSGARWPCTRGRSGGTPIRTAMPSSANWTTSPRRWAWRRRWPRWWRASCWLAPSRSRSRSGDVSWCCSGWRGRPGARCWASSWWRRCSAWAPACCSGRSRPR